MHIVDLPQLARAAGISALLATLCLGCEAPDASSPLEIESNAAALNEAATWGFAWANKASQSSYTPDANFARSSSGGTIKANRLGTGSYRVDFAGLGGTGGFAIAVAVGLDNRRCTVDSYSNSGGTERVFVKCHNPSGSAANSQFNVFYQRRDATISTAGVYGAYLRSDGNGTIVASDSWNSRGQANTVTRMNAGFYVARLKGLGSGENSTVIASAYNTTGHCKVSKWGISENLVDQEVQIACYDTSAKPADRKFSLSYGSYLSPVGTPSVGYAWFNDPGSTMFQPDASRRAIVINGTSIGARDADVGAGNYFTISGIRGHQYVLFNRNAHDPPGFLEWRGVNGIATATGFVDTYCKLETVTNIIARVDTFCFTGTGANAVSTMNAAYATAQTQ